MSRCGKRELAALLRERVQQEGQDVRKQQQEKRRLTAHRLPRKK